MNNKEPLVRLSHEQFQIKDKWHKEIVGNSHEYPVFQVQRWIYLKGQTWWKKYVIIDQWSKLAAGPSGLKWCLHRLHLHLLLNKTESGKPNNIWAIKMSSCCTSFFLSVKLVCPNCAVNFLSAVCWKWGAVGPNKSLAAKTRRGHFDTVVVFGQSLNFSFCSFCCTCHSFQVTAFTFCLWKEKFTRHCRLLVPN